MNKKMRNFEEKCGRAAELSHAVLREILKDNEETEYGKKNGFGRLQDLREYRRLPLTDYADYAESIERMKRGEKNVLTAYQIFPVDFRQQRRAEKCAVDDACAGTGLGYGL